MKIIVISRDGARRRLFNLSIILHVILPVLLAIVIFVGGALLLSPQFTTQLIGSTQLAEGLTEPSEKAGLQLLQKSVAKDVQQLELEASNAQDKASLGVLISRLGEMEAEMVRLNGIASRVIQRAHLDPEEFALDQKLLREEGALGAEGLKKQMSYPKLFNKSEHLKKRQGQYKQVLNSLYHLLSYRALEYEYFPSGMPVKVGRISSSFGMRQDPFTRSRRFHRGVDFAARKGTAVYSIGAGTVVFVGRKGAYGLTVDLDHGKGFVSRYAHLSKSMVIKGQVVNKTQKIAAIGNTGRSTGPHLHLEIIHHGKQVNPMIYLKRAN